MGESRLKENNDAGGAIGAVHWVLVALGAVACIVFVATIIAASNVDNSMKPHPFGTAAFGDAFGLSTSLFTGIAFLGLMLTLNLQRKELKLVREERDASQRTLQNQIETVGEQQKYQDRVYHEGRAARLLDSKEFELVHSTGHGVTGASRQRRDADNHIYAKYLRKLNEVGIHPYQRLSKQVEFKEAVTLPQSVVCIWLSIWESINRSEQLWMRSLLDAKTGSSSNYILVWYYFVELQETGVIREQLLDYYSTEGLDLFGVDNINTSELK